MEDAICTSVKRTRASGPKVRTGCLTCKSRHVKCDERKPECLRCTSTGRRCEGYLHLETRRNSIPSSSEEGFTSDGSPAPSFANQLQLFVVHSPKEVRSIELFFLKAAPQLSGYFQEPFWNFALQFSFDEAAIRHALVAVSAEYEDGCFIGVSPCAGTAALKKLSLEYYNRAIRSMVKKLQGKDSILVPVMGCIIFVCLEFLRRDILSATKHIDSGIKMIEQWRIRQRRLGKLPDDLGSTLSETAIVERVIVPMFAFLNLQTAVFGRPSLTFFSRYGNPNSSSLIAGPLNNLEDALTSLLDLSNASMRFVHRAGDVKYKPHPPLDTLLEQASLLKLMDQWRWKADVLEREQGQNWSLNFSKGMNMLKANHLCIRMVLTVACSPYETAWDAHKDDFEEIIRLSDILTEDAIRFPDEVSKHFSFELGLLPPLNIVSWKCRYPNIRRKALSLLGKSPQRECLFEGRYCTALNERIMELEELALKLPPGQIPHTDELPPESARIHLIYFAQAQPGIPEPEEGWEVAFFSRPFGLDGQWNIWKEFIDVDKAKYNNEWALALPSSINYEESPKPYADSNTPAWDWWRMPFIMEPTPISLTADA